MSDKTQTNLRMLKGVMNQICQVFGINTDVEAASYTNTIKMFEDVDWREMFMEMSA